MLASEKDDGWLGITTGVVEMVEAAVHKEEPAAREAGWLRGSAKKPGQVELAGQLLQAGGVP